MKQRSKTVGYCSLMDDCEFQIINRHKFYRCEKTTLDCDFQSQDKTQARKEPPLYHKRGRKRTYTEHPYTAFEHGAWMKFKKICSDRGVDAAQGLRDAVDLINSQELFI